MLPANASTDTSDMRWGRSLGNLTAPLIVREKQNWRNVMVSSVTDDSRCVEPGALFVAVSGEECDGHDFLSDAVRRGAAAVVCERPTVPGAFSCPVIRVHNARHALSAVSARFFGTMESGLKTIGVTGTDGKTTTTYLVRSVLQEAGLRAGLLGTLKYDFGARSLESTQTTPHPVLLHSMLHEMRCSRMSHAVMEVSSHGLVHRRVAHVPFDLAILTNVTEDHLDFHGTIEEYIRAKGRLFRQLSADSVAILNADCPVWRRYARSTRASVLTYGINGIADIKLVNRIQSIDGTVMEVRTPFESYELKTSLVGDFNCENILAAAAAAFASGISGGTVSRAIGKFAGMPGRLEEVRSENDRNLPSFFVDYAHTPDALRKILATLKPLTEGQLICVFGCGGDREREKRAKMGNIATTEADVTVVTSDNSRSELTEDIIDDIVEGIDKSAGRYVTEPDRRRAIEKALDVSNSSEDVIVVCGKGAERFQLIGGRKIPFDDRVVCRQVMERAMSKKRKTA